MNEYHEDRALEQLGLSIKKNNLLAIFGYSNSATWQYFLFKSGSAISD